MELLVAGLVGLYIGIFVAALAAAAKRGDER